MTPEDLIADLRSRINPAYAAQLGTESYERRVCAEALESQAEEIERLRNALSEILEYDTRVMYERCPDCWSDECKKLGRCRDVPLSHAGKIAHAALEPNSN